MNRFKLNIGQNLYLVLFFFLLIILVILIVLLISKCFTKKSKKGVEDGDKPKLRDQLEFKSLIKKGKFKQSFYGCRLGEKLFVKKFDKKIKAEWANEIEIYSLPLIRHENIVDFVGKDNLLIATIYYELGSLTNYLNENHSLDEDQLLQLMLSSAQGLNHLHQNLEFKPSIVHRNLDSNHFIVVNCPELKCKLTNFSNALTYTRFDKLEKDRKLKQLKTVNCDSKYCPPEYFNQTINFKNFLSFLNADVYSFSLILWQIANHHSQGDLNQEDSLNDLDQDFRYSAPFVEYFDNKRSEFDQMKELLKDDLKEDSIINRPTIYFDASKVRTFNGHVIIKLIEECWSPNSDSRLSISRIVKDLIQLYNNHQINQNNLSF